MAKYAPKSEDGLFAYVQTAHSPWPSRDGRKRIVWAESLTEAKRQYGSTRELHVSLSIKRATVEQLAELGGQ